MGWPGWPRIIVIAVATAVAAVTSVVVIAPPAEAAVIRPFTARFTTNAPGAIKLIGNNVLTCMTAVTPNTCGNAQTARNVNNNGVFMGYIDPDGAVGVFNGSSATLALPAVATIRFAGLYWGADTSSAPASNCPAGGRLTPGAAAPTPAARDIVQFQVPGQPAAVITASTVDASGTRYQGFADVTARVVAAGPGEYSVSNVQAGTGCDRYGGWSLVVAYEDPGEPPRNLTVFDGYAIVADTPADRTVDMPITGFETPPAGPVTTRVGAVVYEGDGGSTGDQLQLQRQDGTFANLSNASNPTTNVFNSTASDLGVLNAARVPANPNMLGFDVDRFDATGVLANGQTNSVVRVTTTSETFFPGVITFATDLFSPELRIGKVGVDLNGGDLEPGDRVHYDVTVHNGGRDAAINAVVSDQLPPFTSFVPGSLAIEGTPVTDGAGDDTGEVVGGVLTARVGEGASSTLGGTLLVQERARFSFDVVVTPDAPDGVSLSNVVATTYEGEQTGIELTSTSNRFEIPVVARSDLTVTKLVTGPAGITVPGSTTFQLVVVNNGPNIEPAAVVTDTLPPGFTATQVVPSQGTCAGTTCTLGPLAVGATATVQITAAVASGSGTAVNSASVSGSNRDEAPTNNTSSATVTLNRPPVATDDSVPESPPGMPVVIPALTNDSDPDFNDSDPDVDDLLSVVDIVQPANGKAVTNPDGTITYTSNEGFKGTETFTYTVSDGRGGSDTATITVDIANAPPVANDDANSGPAGQPVTGEVLLNDDDPNSDPLTATLAIPPPAAAGTVVVDTDGSYTFLPTVGFTGTTTFTYLACDNDVPAACDEATVTITITNDPPVAADDTATTGGDTGVVIPVLDNDTDPQADPLTVTEVTSPINGGSVVINDDGTVTYTPPDGFKGTDTFTYAACDDDVPPACDTATVSVTVDNAPPTAMDDTATVNPDDGLVTIPVLANDSDPNPVDSLTVVGIADVSPSNGTAVVMVNPDGTIAITYAPNPGFRGTDTFTYTISDGDGGTDTATVTVNVPNAPPIATNDERTTLTGQPVTVPVLLNDTDVNSDALTVVAAGPPANGTVVLNADGTITYTPNPGFFGTDTFTYVVSDGNGGTSLATVTIDVLNVPPTATNDTATAPPSGGPVTIPVLDNDSDPNGDPIFTVIADQPANGAAVVNTDGTITHTPRPGFRGNDTFTYWITDGNGNVVSASVTVTVPAPVTVPPRARPPLPMTGAQSGDQVLASLLLMAAGGVLLAWSRRRRPVPRA